MLAPPHAQFVIPDAPASRSAPRTTPFSCTMRLLEKSHAPQPSVIGTDGSMLIRIIAPGQGSSGRYSREVLERDIPRAFPQGTPMYANHATETEALEQPERRIEALAATFAEDPTYKDDGPAGPGAYVKVQVVEHWAPILAALAQHGIGTSIDADGLVTIAEDGVPEIQSILKGRSVDFVTRAGAGGTIIPLVEAARSAGLPTPILEEKPMPDQNEEIRSLTERITTLQAENTTLLREQQTGALREAARRAATTVLAGIEMPEPAKARVLETEVSRAPANTEGKLDESAFKTLVESAAAAEIAYAQTAFGYRTGQVQGQGGQTRFVSQGDKTTPTPVMESLGPVRAAIGLG